MRAYVEWGSGTKRSEEKRPFTRPLVVPRWRGLLAFLFPPFAVLYGWRAGRRINVVVWLTSALIYVAGFGASYWGR